MKAVSNRYLHLVSPEESSSPNNVTVESFNKTATLNQAAISLLAAQATGRISQETIDTLHLVLQDSNYSTNIIQRSLDLSILLKNIEGDASICFKYDIVNLGKKALPSRSHRYWFTSPQEDLNLLLVTDSGAHLEIENLSSSPYVSEFRVHFPKPLTTTDQLSYRIQYQVKKNFFESNFYDITTSSLTRNMSMTILAPENTSFKSTSVSLESADGYISDCPPIPSVTTEYGRDKLTWNYTQSKLGDQFRTRWSLV